MKRKTFYEQQEETVNRTCRGDCCELCRSAECMTYSSEFDYDEGLVERGRSEFYDEWFQYISDFE